jgi:hypothetical protein
MTQMKHQFCYTVNTECSFQKWIEDGTFGDAACSEDVAAGRGAAYPEARHRLGVMR